MKHAEVMEPVKSSDRVSDVLARDESLVEVFVRQAPHFSKLRNRAMRKVMARLVTVEQAARTANVSPDGLVRELNAALGLTVDESDIETAPIADAPSTHDTHPAAARVVELDVREDLRLGREPFSRIMAAVGALADEDVLHLRAIFEPAPLFAVLAKRGYRHESQAHADDDWSVWFWRSNEPEPIVEQGDAPVDDELPRDDATTTHLDVRGLMPPEPMTRTLIALETLPPGHTLVQINSRVPRFLLPMLVERGFTWEIDETRPDRVLVRIRHV